MKTLTQFVNESFSRKQEDLIYDAVVQAFEKKYTDDYWHFSTEYLWPHKAIYEIHSSKGSFRATIKISNKRPLKKSIIFEEIKNYNN